MTALRRAVGRAACDGTADLARVVAVGLSGRELTALGCAEDTAVATQEDACALVPVRDGEGAFAPG
ncbi:hypothetical protein [Streptomyces sp. NBC_01235]|uniref:hypothetical protein n=1 Tax=Streptomyces sp. NBC_01235 TaxID=2903788 RepID=UPI002E12D821|nr:hypothetical protein OG289_39230 [Streptomyces sp. NBC_01235]